jgi:catechol 2,3-dioxygenase-like lactoylglutathione lyase family enzyme
VRFAHLTLPTRDVDRTARFLEDTLGFTRLAVPGNSPVEAQWLDIGGGQQLHVLHVDDFAVSPYEGEFGRHVALYHPLERFDTVKQRLLERGATVFNAVRATPFERFFFREPVNGYVFEVIDAARESRPAERQAPLADHFDQ